MSFLKVLVTSILFIGLTGCATSPQLSQKEQVQQEWDREILAAKESATLQVYVIRHFHPQAVSSKSLPLKDSDKTLVENCQNNIDSLLFSLKEQGVESILIEGLSWKSSRGGKASYSEQDLKALGVEEESHDFTAVKLFSVYGAEPTESAEIGRAVFTATFPKIMFAESSKHIETLIGKDEFGQARQEIKRQSELVHTLMRNEMALDVSHMFRSFYSLMRAIHIANRDKLDRIAIVMGDAHYEDYLYVAKKLPLITITPVSCSE